MIELALLYRILRFADRALNALRKVVALPAALSDSLFPRAVSADHAAGLAGPRSGLSTDTRVLRVRRRGHACPPVELARREDVTPPTCTAA